MQLRSRAAAPLPKPSWVLAWVPTVEFVDDELPEDACVGLPEAGGGPEQRLRLELSVFYGGESCHRRWFLAAAHQGPQRWAG